MQYMAPTNPEILRQQFLLTQVREENFPATWSVKELRGWMLVSHESTPIADVVDPSGQQIGWIVGQAISSSGEFLPDVITLDPLVGDDDVLEGELYKLSGRWVAILLTEEKSRVYLDAAGSLGVVYSLRQPVVASTPSLVDAKSHPYIKDLVDLLDLPRANRWYPAGLTPREGLLRLLPNHMLDLSNREATRHYYCQPYQEVSAEQVHASIEEVVDRIKFVFDAIAKKGKVLLPITAGRDSRMLLACAKSIRDHIACFTFESGAKKKTVDEKISVHIAKRFRLSHRLVPVTRSDERVLEEWGYLTGGCAGGDIAQIYSSLQEFDANSTLTPGMMGEVGRAFYWQEEDNVAEKVMASDLLERAKLPDHSMLVEAMQRWLDELSEFNRQQVLDLFYLEQRGGCWAAPQQYGSDRFVLHHIMPFVDRVTIDRMMSLPLAYKVSNRFADDVIKIAWPELLSVPFNQLTFSMRVQRKLSRFF